MSPTEHNVRESAASLLRAITEAEAGGFRIAWPASAAGLSSIGISETGKVQAALVPVATAPASRRSAEAASKTPAASASDTLKS